MDFSDRINEVVREMFFATARELEATLLEIFGTEENARRESCEWPLFLASMPGNGLRQFYSLEKQCPIHGAYCNMRPIKTREEWDRARAEFDVDECLSCAAMAARARKGLANEQ